jgi:hypothetical protein
LDENNTSTDPRRSTNLKHNNMKEIVPKHTTVKKISLPLAKKKMLRIVRAK